LILAVCLAVIVFISWRGLERPLQQVSAIEFPFYVFAAAIFVKCLFIFRCARERLVVGLALANLVISAVLGLASVREGVLVNLIKYSKFGLWSLALLISISILISSTRQPGSPLKDGGAMVTNRGLLVTGIVVAAVLVGMLMYFVPSR
jgi:hypothetical protein